MQDALHALPGVEPGSVKVDQAKKLASFKVKDPKEFKTEDAVAKIGELGSKYKASVARVGTGLTAPPAK